MSGFDDPGVYYSDSFGGGEGPGGDEGGQKRIQIKKRFREFLRQFRVGTDRTGFTYKYRYGNSDRTVLLFVTQPHPECSGSDLNMGNIANKNCLCYKVTVEIFFFKVLISLAGGLNTGAAEFVENVDSSTEVLNIRPEGQNRPDEDSSVAQGKALENVKECVNVGLLTIFFYQFYSFSCE